MNKLVGFETTDRFGSNPKDEHPPAMHNAMGWCKHGYINQKDKLATRRFQGIAGRSNIERPTSNIEWKKMNKQTCDLEERLLEYSVRIINNQIKMRSEATSLFDVQRWKFDPPEADKCLLAYGELEVHLYFLKLPLVHPTKIL